MTSSTSPPPTLLNYISTELSKTYPTESSKFRLNCIRSQPRRSYALFPHSTNHKTCKIWQEEVLCVLNVHREATSISVEKGKGKETEEKDDDKVVVEGFVPLCAIEASIYTIPSTSTSILYISKVDTTGLQPTSPSPSPTKSFISSFIRYHFLFPPHETTRLRLHIFAKSQPQYLFPGSIENSPQFKKVLDDKQLLKWWKSTLQQSLPNNLFDNDNDNDKNRLKKFYAVAGLNYLESLPYLPSSNTSSSSEWIYGHPYSTLSSPLHPPSSAPSDHPITDQIPSFPDDPKSRFLHSLTSSSLSPSGTDGDYDDLHYNLNHLTFSSGGASGTKNSITIQQRKEEIETERLREQSRLIKECNVVEEWWERLQFRQECCSGVLVGFFVVSLEPEPNTTLTSTSTSIITSSDEAKSTNNVAPPRGYPFSLPHSVFTKLWTQIHNLDYSSNSLSSLIPSISKWSSDVLKLVGLSEIEKQNKKKNHKQKNNDHPPDDVEKENEETELIFQVKNLELVEKLKKKKQEEELKRKLNQEEGKGGGGGGPDGEVKKVNTLAPRKKKKVT
ncbi:hypothetical protein JCM3765_006239 [Sporobolomyces pararoseus]